MSATAVRDRRQITLPEDISEDASLKVGDQVQLIVKAIHVLPVKS